MICLIIGIAGIVLGVLIGYFAKGNCTKGPCLGSGVPDKIIADGDTEITQKIFDGIKADNIRKYLK